MVKENGTYQTMLKFVVNEITQNKIMVTDLSDQAIRKQMEKGNINVDTAKIVSDILNKIQNQQVKMTDISSSNLSYMQIEYYTLIAMACMYGGMLGLTAINACLANMSSKGKRISVSPNRKSTVILSAAMGSYFVSLVGLAILMLFLKFALQVDFGDNPLLVLLLAAVGNLAGISLGILIASIFRVSEGAKTGITIAVTMFLSVLSGMMVKGKFEHSDRGNQIMAFEVEAIELNEADARPSHLELKVSSADFNQATSQRLNRILKSYPGRDGVVLFVSQGDGRKFRAELPVTVDARSQIMLSEIQDLFGRPVWSRAS